jgi:hypothetical protein
MTGQHDNVGAALVAMFAEVRATRDTWLQSEGLTLDEAKSTVGAERARLELRYQEFVKNN